jgi:hypothetical protein
MARLQILELPEGSGDDRPPFVLVIDQCIPQRIALGADAPYRDYWQDLAQQIGARGVIVTPETVDIPANDTTAYLGAGSDPLAEALFDAERYKQDHLGACRTVAAVHAAATGRTGEGPIRGVVEDVEDVRLRLEQAEQERDEARQWARHGYEIGQKHCGWTDHGVAPDWLTEGWPQHFDSCEHLKQMAEFDEALTRVLNAPTKPDAMNAQQERPDIWLHGYECGVLAAKAAARPRNEPTVKPSDA